MATHLHLQISNAQADQLRNPQAGGVQHLEHGLVPYSEWGAEVRLLEEPVHFLQPQVAWQAPPDLRRLQGKRRVGRDCAFGNRKAEEVAERD